MQRRSNAIRGYVNFPVNDSAYKNSGEGGMFVRLVVHQKDDWMVCCGGSNCIIYDECLIGTKEDVEKDLASWNAIDDSDHNKLVASLNSHQKAVDKKSERHFPHLNKTGHDLDNFVSIPYLAVLTIGSTGWSGWHKERACHWACGYENLTKDGKALYDSIQKLYKGCKTELITWLDT